MKITNVEALVLSCPLPKVIHTSFGEMKDRIHSIVKIDTDEGISGYGEMWSNYPLWNAYDKKNIIEHGFREMLIGKNPMHNIPLYDQLYRVMMRSGAGRQWGAYGHIMQALSGIDMALWDIKGKLLNLPVYQLLGGLEREQVPGYASGFGPPDFTEEVTNALNAGYQSFKLKIGFGEDTDYHNLKTIREMIGPDKRLFIDVNQGYDDAEQTLAMLDTFNEFEFVFVEEPVLASKHGELKKIKEAGYIVAGGENLYGTQQFLQTLQAGCLDFIQPDVAKAGGITEMIRIIQIARAFDIDYAPHMFGTALGQAASMHIIFSQSGGMFMEVDANPNPFLSNFYTDRFYTFKDGGFRIAKEMPGLGISLDEAFIKKYKI